MSAMRKLPLFSARTYVESSITTLVKRDLPKSDMVDTVVGDSEFGILIHLI